MYNPQITVERIRELRERQGISAADLNEECALNKSTINMSAASKNGLSARIIADVSQVLNCAADYLLGLSDNESGGLTAEETELVEIYRSLSDSDKIRLIERGYALSESDK